MSMSVMEQRNRQQKRKSAALLLHEQFPKSTLNECKRFLHACGIDDTTSATATSTISMIDGSASSSTTTASSSRIFGSRLKNIIKKKNRPPDHTDAAAPADSNSRRQEQQQQQQLEDDEEEDKEEACQKKEFEAAATMLQSYLDWRLKYHLDDDDEENNPTAYNDALNWEHAVSKAIKYSSNTSNNATPSNNRNSKSDSKMMTTAPEAEAAAAAAAKESSHHINDLDERDVPSNTSETESSVSTTTSALDLLAIPQWVFLHSQKESSDGSRYSNDSESGDVYYRDKRGKKILHVIPAKIDKSIISDINIHALVVAFYLDRILCMSKNEKNDNDSVDDTTITLYIDTRPGNGWPNPIAITMVSLISKIIHILQSYYPGRLETVIVFPIPYIALYVWNTIKSFLYQKTLERIIIIPGSANVNSKVNEKKQQQYILPYIDNELVIQFEKKRIELFK